jgi:hypothetical protein
MMTSAATQALVPVIWWAMEKLAMCGPSSRRSPPPAGERSAHACLPVAGCADGAAVLRQFPALANLLPLERNREAMDDDELIACGAGPLWGAAVTTSMSHR